MEQAEVESARRRVQDAAREWFPDGAVQEVALLQYGDDPRVEPGQLVVRVLVPADTADTAETAETAEKSETAETASPGAGKRAGFGRDPFDAFKRAHPGALEGFRDVIDRGIPEVSVMEVTVDAGPERKGVMRMRLGHPPADRPGDLTPVMARLGPTDLQTLDTLITTGIAANRADAVRWALARIRERSAYAELRERARQIEELKTQF
jgi:hypothetical protein